MNLPKPYADEEIYGILGRIQRLNCQSDHAVTLKHLRSLLDTDPNVTRMTSSILVLADVLGIERASFVQQHSRLPLRQPFSKPVAQGPFSKQLESSANDRHMVRHRGTGANFCPECCFDDLERIGESYWHREHQLPGLEWCRKHLTPLVRVSSPEWFLNSPHTLIESSYPNGIAYRPDHPWSKNPVLSKLANIQLAALALTYPIDQCAYSAWLKETAIANNIWNRSDAASDSFDNLIIRAVPAGWLEKWMPKVKPSSPGERGFLSRNILQCRNITAIQCFVSLAAFCPTAEDALASIMSCKPPPPKQEQNYGRIRDRLQGADFLDTYVESGGTTSRIRRIVPLRGGDAENELCKAGLPPIRRHQKAMPAALQSFFSGQSLLVVSENFGIPMADLEYMLRNGAFRLQAAVNSIVASQGDPSRKGHQGKLDLA